MTSPSADNAHHTPEDGYAGFDLVGAADAALSIRPAEMTESDLPIQ